MTFLSPILASVGLACVAIPIIIHILMRRRRRPIQWAAMRFLLEAYRQHKRRLKLEQILLLASRCLVVALVALALGRPLLGKAGILGGRGAVTLYLLIDNGLASSARPAEGGAVSALDRHKAAAKSLLDQLDPASGDRAALIALGGPAQSIVSPPSSSAAAVAELVRTLAPTDSPTDIPGAIAAVRESLNGHAGENAGHQIIVVLSDFLSGSADTERKLAEIGRREGVLLMASAPAGTGASNVTIASLEPDRPVLLAAAEGPASQQTPVRLLLRRSGPGAAEAAATTVHLTFQTETASGLSTGVPAGQTVVRWAPGQTEATATATAELAGAGRAAGPALLTATIDADAVGGDNAWRRPIEVRRSLRIGLVAPRRLGAIPSLQQYEPADWYRAALQPGQGAHADSEIEIVEIDPGTLDTPRLAGLDGAIIAAPDAVPEGAWRKIRAFAESGGLVVVSPPAKGAVHVWADAMTRDLTLPWTVAREARVWEGGQAISPQRPTVSGPDLLSLISAELGELAPPVRAWRALHVENAAGGGAAPGTLLTLSDGSPVLLAAAPGSKETPGSTDAGLPQRGLVVLLTLAPSFDWTDMQAKPLMVPLLQEVVREGVGRARGVWASLAGGALALPPRTVELRALGDTAPASVKATGDRAAEPLRRAGLWRAVDETGASRGIVAVNADPAGGRCEPQSPSAIGTWLSTAVGGAEVRWLDGDPKVGGLPGGGTLRSALQRSEDGSRFVLPLLIAALVLAVLELALGRWFSHAVMRPSAPGAPA